MKNTFCKKPLYDCSQKLVRVAMGKEPADLVVKNARLVNVCTREILDNISVAVTCGRIALVGDALFTIGENTVVVDANGRYLAPAFMDGHMHVESSMLSVGEYARAVIPHGTAGVFFDPHEICNVLGLDGVRYMLDDAKRTPLKAMLTVPSCVPAVSGFEDTGAEIHPEDVANAMTWDECVGLGEMMNFPGILSGDDHTHQIVAETLKADKCVTGHYSIPDTGAGLNAYIATGIRCCHESTRACDALAKMRLGMYAMLREGSAWRDLEEVSRAITEHTVDSRFACLVSDDSHPHTLKTKGHLDHIVRRAVETGIDFVSAVQMATINVATCFGLEDELGSVAPGKCADFILIDDPVSVSVSLTVIDGEIVAKDGKMLREFAPYAYPENALHTVHLNPVTEDDFAIPASGDSVNVRTIEITPAKVGTKEVLSRLAVKDGKILADGENDVLKAVVFERHKKTGTKGFGFVKGFGIRDGALAQTVAHDAHNLFVIGSNDRDMALAANTLIESGGGLVAVQNGVVLGHVPLPIAGLMSADSLEVTDERVERLSKAWKQMGCVHPSPFMTMAIIPLACIPDIRLTNRGLVDIKTFRFVDLIVKD